MAMQFLASDSALWGFAGADHGERFFDATGARFRLLGALDPIDVFLFVGVGERGEGLRLRRACECGFEIGGDSDGAGSVVEGELDLDCLAGGCAGCSEHVFADAEDVYAGARHERVAEGEAVDGGADRDLTLAAEDLRDAEGDLHVGPGAAGATANELALEFEWVRFGFGHCGAPAILGC